MKHKIPTYLTLLILITTTLNGFDLTPAASSNTDTIIQQHYHFNTPDLFTIKPIRLLLPPSTTIKNITITTSNAVPLSPTITRNSDIKTRSFSSHQTTITTSPSTLYTPPNIQHFRGYSILNTNLHPVQYNNTTNTFCFYKNITLTINTVPISSQPQTPQIPQIHPLYRNGIDQEELLSKIDNPEVIAQYSTQYPITTQSHLFDYLIITTNDLKNTSPPYNLNTLINHREAQGLSCIIKTVEDIQSEYPGIDTPEKIRNFIKDAYSIHGISWVLLAGDVDKVPIRYLYDIDGDEPTKQISSDLYYQCLDGTYNHDNDRHWGEKYDGPDNTLIDLYAEVYIGRAPADDARDISSFVEKTLAYETTSHPYTMKHLSIGQKVWDGYGGWGSGYAELCIDNHTDYNHITHGIPSTSFTITRLYDTPDKTLSKTDVIREINEGVGIINHVGHGTVNKAMELSTCDITTLTNTNKYSLLYSQACNSGKLESQDECFAERWVNAEKAGGFAAIMNTGEGYGSETDYDGPDNRYAREFFDALFSPDEKISRLGKANQDSKEDNIWRIHENQKNMYHVYYNTLLFGDPYVQIKGSGQANQMPPHAPNKPSGPTIGFLNNPYTFTTNTTDPNEDHLKYIWSFGDQTIVTDWHTSGQPCTISHTWNSNGTYHIRVKAKDSSMAESDWSPILTFTVGDNTIPSVTITKPEKAIYIQNIKILPLPCNPFILGKIDITVNATDSTSSINNVTFYIDNIIVKVDTEIPFTYTWDEKSFGRHTIKVIAYDFANNYNTVETKVWKFF